MARSLFQSIRSQGALLPADYLLKIVEGKADGVNPESYHLPPGTRLRSEAYQVYERLLKYWTSFQEARSQIPDGQSGEGVTNEKWTTHLLAELRWGRPAAGPGLTVNDRHYDVKRFGGHVPIHLLGCNQPLDRRGGASAIPHGLVQEFLNSSDDHLWGIVTNGLQLRLLRDNPALSRMAFVEFDLEAMMEDPSLFSDFLIFWHVCHCSRLEAPVPEETWLEKWSQGAIKDGAPILDKLRVGVERAVVHLGKGFLENRANEELREKIRNQELSPLEYYRQLLRIIYRLLFLFVAEDRKLLHSPDASEDAKKNFDEFYSTRRLRELADSMRGTPHADLWHQLSLLFQSMGNPNGCPQLGIPALGSFLWKSNPSSTPDLDGPRPGDDAPGVQLSNQHLLAAIREIAYLQDDRNKAYRPVDFRVLDTRAFGSVYESLLELHPFFDTNGRNFELRSSSGADRKQTGSYYTPDSLVQCLLDSALEPVVKQRLEGKTAEEQEQALLSLKVCDPAVGSGHFLISAAHRLAYRLSRITSGDTEPSPEAYQEALRRVTANCLYGVDLNPMAVELCQFTLWLESVEPGKPFAFLEHHIQCGNSLLGTTPRLLAEGIPDGAYKALEGDDREACTTLKRRNVGEREGYGEMFDQENAQASRTLRDATLRLSEVDDSTTEGIARKERDYEVLKESEEWKKAKRLADLWCAAFVFKKEMEEGFGAEPIGITTQMIRDAAAGGCLKEPIENVLEELVTQYDFFHWHLAFPEVFQVNEQGTPENEGTGWNGGFDVILGNPPWERIKLQEKEFFASRDPDIANAPNAAARRRMIAALQTENPGLFEDFKQAVREAEGTISTLSHSNAYPLCGRGDVNLYTVFAEANRFHLNPTGLTGLVLPTGIATDDTTKFFFQDLMNTKSLSSLYDFENKNIFPNVHSSYKFCCFTAGSGVAPIAESAEFAFFLHATSELSDPNKRFRLSPEDIALLNPNTRTCPIFRNKIEAVLIKRIFSISTILQHNTEKEIYFGGKCLSTFHMSANAEHFVNPDQIEDGNPDILPLYESKMFHQFNPRYGSVNHYETGAVNSTIHDSIDLSSDMFTNKPRYYINKDLSFRKFNDGKPYDFILGFRKITRSTDIRTSVAAIFPRVALGDSINSIVGSSARNSLLLVSVINSFAFDYVSRSNIGGINFSFWTFKQMAVPLRMGLTFLEEKEFFNRSLELTYNYLDLENFALSLGVTHSPFRWDEERRFLLRCELDAAFFHLYLGSLEDWQAEGTPELLEAFPNPRDAVNHIMETFPIVKKKDIKRTEVKDDSGNVVREGTFITKDTILSIYDDMAEAQRAGQPYQTRLDPPPADPSCAHPPRA